MTYRREIGPFPETPEERLKLARRLLAQLDRLRSNVITHAGVTFTRDSLNADIAALEAQIAAKAKPKTPEAAHAEDIPGCPRAWLETRHRITDPEEFEKLKTWRPVLAEASVGHPGLEKLLADVDDAIEKGVRPEKRQPVPVTPLAEARQPPEPIEPRTETITNLARRLLAGGGK